MALIPYVTNKRLIVDYNWAGVTYYLLCIVIVTLYAYGIFQSGSYLKREEVTALVNPYVQAAAHPVRQCEASNTCSQVYTDLFASQYCSNASYSYHYDTVFKYSQGAPNEDIGPACRAVNVYEVSSKDDNLVTFSTVFNEWEKFAWPCHLQTSGNLPFDPSVSCGVNPVIVEPTGQCSCNVEKAVFPLAIEDYTVKMPHSYIVRELNGLSWRGNSAFDQAELDGLEPELRSEYPHLMSTTLRLPDGHGGFSETVIEPGQDIGFTLKQILQMVNIDLDTVNKPAGGDYRTSTHPDRYPTFRHTGLSLIFDLHYTNRESGEVIFWDQAVDATVTVENETTTWASVGPTASYSVFPEGAEGNQTYHRVIRYPQDVKIKFVARGFVYAFDPATLIQTFIVLAVTLGVARTIMDFILFRLIPAFLPGMIILANKREERITRRSVFMEVGMEAAVGARQFKNLDDDEDGKLSLTDLTKVFGALPEVDKNRALMISKTILGHRKAKSGSGVDFNDFMTIMHGDAIEFKHYLTHVSATGGNLRSLGTAKSLAEDAYDEAAKGIELPEESKTPQKDPVRLQPAGGASSSQPPPASPPVMPMQAPGAGAYPQQPQMLMPAPAQPQIIRLACYNCKRHFGCPPGAKQVVCPYCQLQQAAPVQAV